MSNKARRDVPFDDLLTYIFDGRPSPLRADFERWGRDSRPFRAFAATYRDKIRTKLRNAGDDAGRLDLRAELAAAALLLQEERFTVEYEKYAAAKQRGPDFSVTFRTRTPFNVEVRRVRDLEPDADARRLRLMAVLSDKAGQMPPSIANLLWLDAGDLAADEVDAAAAALVRLAERKTEEYFTRRGFESAAGFLRAYQRLSGIILRGPDGLTLLPNPLARHKLPALLVAALKRLGAADGG